MKKKNTKKNFYIMFSKRFIIYLEYMLYGYIISKAIVLSKINFLYITSKIPDLELYLFFRSL